MPFPTKSEVECYNRVAAAVVVEAVAVVAVVVRVGVLRVVVRVWFLRLGMLRLVVRVGVLSAREPLVIQETLQSRTISSQIRRTKQRKKLPPKLHDKQ